MKLSSSVFVILFVIFYICSLICILSKSTTDNFLYIKILEVLSIILCFITIFCGFQYRYVKMKEERDLYRKAFIKEWQKNYIRSIINEETEAHLYVN